MTDGGLTVLDGSLVRAVDLSVPEPGGTSTGAQLVEIAESRVSASLFGLPLPEYLKSSAIKRLSIGDSVVFRRSEFGGDEAASVLSDFITAIADELKDDPLVVAVLDGRTLRLFLEDEDDFAMLAENLFTDLDTEDKGKISKNELRNALLHMGVELGIPPFSEYPKLNDILEKHVSAEKEEELGQAQFAQLLQQVLQELAEALSEEHVVVIQNIKLINGSKIRKLLASEEKLKEVEEKIMQYKNESSRESSSNLYTIRAFLEENEKDLGLPFSKADESVVLLYDEVFSDVRKRNESAESEEEIGLLVKEILATFAEKLEANPVFQDHHIT